MKYPVAALLMVLGLMVASPASADDEFTGGGGIYFAPTFLLAGKWQEDAIYDASDNEFWAQDWKYRGFTPGFGVFGEFALHRHFLLGLEGYLAFPEVKQFRMTDAPAGVDTGTWEDFDATEKDFMLSLMLRFKAPFRLTRLVTIYPIVGFGFSYYMSKTEEGGTDASFSGIVLMGGFGTEIDAHRFVTPFAEVRYMLAAGWHDEKQAGLTEEARVMTHALAILVGVRFP
ncbi:MAG: outer membrane beta-barrel protein [Deltaproteobacteria bacterium]|nr:outer membrane beta-barrel protein [Deltaproteobacteria bacterium]